MNIVVSGIHLTSDPESKEYAQKKSLKLLKYHSKITDIKVRLFSEKSHRSEDHDYYCELTVHVPGKILEIVDKQRTMMAAIDKAIDRMKVRLIKEHQRAIEKDHNRNFVRRLVKRFRR